MHSCRQVMELFWVHQIFAKLIYTLYAMGVDSVSRPPWHTSHTLNSSSVKPITRKQQVWNLSKLRELITRKQQVARAYNKKVKNKSFQVGDLVWKTILPLGVKSNKFGKWSPSWVGLLKVIKVVFGNSYVLETLQGECLPRAINGRYLKQYFPSVWQEAWKLSRQWPMNKYGRCLHRP